MGSDPIESIGGDRFFFFGASLREFKNIFRLDVKLCLVHTLSSDTIS